MRTYLSTSAPTLLPGAGLVSSRRARLHLSLSQLAEQCDLPVRDLEMLEQARFVPSPSQAYALARTLQIDRDRFCNWALDQLFRHPQFLLHHAQGAHA